MGELALFNKVVVRYHTEEEPTVVHEVEREIPDQKEGRVMYLNDSPKNWPMSHAEASNLATRVARNIEKRREVWTKQYEKGRTPGASSRPKKV